MTRVTKVKCLLKNKEASKEERESLKVKSKPRLLLNPSCKNPEEPGPTGLVLSDLMERKLPNKEELSQSAVIRCPNLFAEILANRRI